MQCTARNAKNSRPTLPACINEVKVGLEFQTFSTQKNFSPLREFRVSWSPKTFRPHEEKDIKSPNKIFITEFDKLGWENHKFSIAKKTLQFHEKQPVPSSSIAHHVAGMCKGKGQGEPARADIALEEGDQRLAVRRLVRRRYAVAVAMGVAHAYGLADDIIVSLVGEERGGGG